MKDCSASLIRAGEFRRSGSEYRQARGGWVAFTASLLEWAMGQGTRAAVCPATCRSAAILEVGQPGVVLAMGSNAPIFLLVILSGSALVLIGISEHRRKRNLGQNWLENMYRADQGDAITLGSPKQYRCYLGGYGGKLGEITLGKNNLFVASAETGSKEYLQVGYHEIIGMDIERPAMPYMMNVSMAAAAANALTQSQAGFNVVITYREGRFSRPFVLGGFTKQSAFDLMRHIESGIEETT